MLLSLPYALEHRHEQPEPCAHPPPRPRPAPPTRRVPSTGHAPEIAEVSHSSWLPATKIHRRSTFWNLTSLSSRRCARLSGDKARTCVPERVLREYKGQGVAEALREQRTCSPWSASASSKPTVRRLVISFKELGARCAAKDTLVVCRAICWFEATELHSIARCRQLERFDLDEGLERYSDEKLPARASWSWFELQ
jgi:hypothetical protein